MTEHPKGKGVPVSASRRQYLLIPHPAHVVRAKGLQPLAAGALDAAVEQMGLTVVRRKGRPRRTAATFGHGPGDATDILVAHIDAERAQLLAAANPHHLHVSENLELRYHGPATLIQQIPFLSGQSAIEPKQLRFRVLGENDRPLNNATVTLTGDTGPSEGTTDTAGEVSLTLSTLPGRAARSVFVKMGWGYWDQYLTDPQLTDSDANVVRLRSYGETVDGFPDGYRYGWGQKLMGLHRMPAGMSGQGVKVAIIDSGADNSHPLLSHIRTGRDFSGSDPTTWNQDLVGHGSHCAGVIAARSESHLTGFAPQSEIHVLKVFPGGRYDSLLDALDYCIEQEIDVVNMSLGGDTNVNQAVEDTLAAAAANGIACVIAAGNSGGAVSYPASSRNALAVAAIGNLYDVEKQTWDSSTVQAQFIDNNGIFSPSFTCHGPEVALCAPGVAIISTVPGDTYASDSGTSMAAPHVTGMAALLLAHHPVFRTELAERNSLRVAGLFQLLRSLCAPVLFGTERTGAGVPQLDQLARFLQLQTAAPAPTAGGSNQPVVYQTFPAASVMLPAHARPGYFAF